MKYARVCVCTRSEMSDTWSSVGARTRVRQRVPSRPCSRACGERFSHLTMTTKAKGFQGQFVCMDREACLQRHLSGGGAMEPRAQGGAPVGDRYAV